MATFISRGDVVVDHSADLLRAVWRSSAQESLNLISRYRMAVRNIPRLTELFDYDSGYANATETDTHSTAAFVMDTYGYMNAKITSNTFHRFTLFPVVSESGRAEIWTAVWSSKYPSGNIGVDATGMKVITIGSVRINLFVNSFKSSLSSVMSIISGIKTCENYLAMASSSPEHFPHETYLYITHIRDVPDTPGNVHMAFQRIAGSSMGLAICAAIMGMVPCMYTGYVQAFNPLQGTNRDQPSMNPLYENIRNGANEVVPVYDQFVSDDIIKSVSHIPLKMGVALYSRCPLVLPHASIFRRTLTQLADTLNVSDEITKNVRGWANDGAEDDNVILNSVLDRVLAKHTVARNVAAAYKQDGQQIWTAFRMAVLAFAKINTTYPGFIMSVINALNANASRSAIFVPSQDCYDIRADRSAFYLATSLAEIPIISKFVSEHCNMNLFVPEEVYNKIKAVAHQNYMDTMDKALLNAAHNSVVKRFKSEKAEPHVQAAAPAILRTIAERNKEANKGVRKHAKVAQRVSSKPAKRDRESTRMSHPSTRRSGSGASTASRASTARTKLNVSKSNIMGMAMHNMPRSMSRSNSANATSASRGGMMSPSVEDQGRLAQLLPTPTTSEMFNDPSNSPPYYGQRESNLNVSPPVFYDSNRPIPAPVLPTTRQLTFEDSQPPASASPGPQEWGKKSVKTQTNKVQTSDALTGRNTPRSMRRDLSDAVNKYKAPDSTSTVRTSTEPQGPTEDE